MVKFILKNECYKVIGACFEVHKVLGTGFLKAIYSEALEIEFSNRKIPFYREKAIRIHYKGKQLRKTYYVDLLCYDSIIIELKATKNLCPEHEAQLLNYLKSSQLRIGLLINFGSTKLQYKRMIL